MSSEKISPFTKIIGVFIILCLVIHFIVGAFKSYYATRIGIPFYDTERAFTYFQIKHNEKEFCNNITTTQYLPTECPPVIPCATCPDCVECPKIAIQNPVRDTLYAAESTKVKSVILMKDSARIELLSGEKFISSIDQYMVEDSLSIQDSEFFIKMDGEECIGKKIEINGTFTFNNKNPRVFLKGKIVLIHFFQ